MTGYVKLMGGSIDYNKNHNEIFNFITTRGITSHVS